LKRAGIIAVLFLLAVETAFFAPLIFTSERLPPTPPSDLHAQILQRIVWAGDFAARYHAIPLWDSYMYAGTPMVGKMQSPVFYPLNWFAAVLPPVVFTNLYLAAHSMLAALFTYLLLRRWKLGHAAALVGAFSYGLGGSLVTKVYAGQMMHIGNWPWLPLQILLAERVAEKRTVRCAALLGLAWAVQFHAGHPQFFVYSSTLLIAYLAMKSCLAGRGNRLRVGVLYGVALAVLVGASAVMLIPALEYIRLMPNAGARDFSYTQSFAMTWAHVARLFYGRRPEYWLMSNADFWESCGYPGLAAILFAATLLGAKRADARTIFFLAGAFTAALFGMGAGGGVFYIFYYLVPGYKLFRIPSRIMMVFNFCVAVLAALGVDSLARRSGQRSETSARRIVAVLAALSVLYAGAFILGQLGGAEPRWAFAQWQTWVVIAAAAAAITALLWRPGKFAAACAVAAVVADMSLFGFVLVQTEPAEISFWKSKLVKRMADDERPFRVLRRSRIIRLSHLTDARLEPISPFVDVNSLATYENMVFGRKWRMEDFKNTLQLFNVKYVVTDGRRNLPLFEFVDAENNRLTGGVDVCLYRFRHYLARAHVVTAEKRLSRGDEAPGRLVRRLDAIDPTREALVERPRLPKETGEYRVTIRDYRPGRMRLALRAVRPGPALLVISENHHPGWRLRDVQTGRRLEVIKVNGGQLGAYIDGPAELELLYLPTTFVAGAAVTVATLAACLVVFAAPRFRKRKAHPRDPEPDGAESRP